jgi:hypothetical protein
MTDEVIRMINIQYMTITRAATYILLSICFFGLPINAIGNTQVTNFKYAYSLKDYGVFRGGFTDICGNFDGEKCISKERIGFFKGDTTLDSNGYLFGVEWCYSYSTRYSPKGIRVYQYIIDTTSRNIIHKGDVVIMRGGDNLGTNETGTQCYKFLYPEDMVKQLDSGSYTFSIRLKRHPTDRVVVEKTIRVENNIQGDLNGPIK